MRKLRTAVAKIHTGGVYALCLSFALLCLLVSYWPLAVSGFGGSVGGAIPRERVRKLAAGRGSVGRVGQGPALS